MKQEKYGWVVVGAAYDALGAYDLPIVAGALCAFLAATCIFVLMQNEAPPRPL